MSTHSEKDPLAFLSGGGTISKLLMSHDWTGTEIGPPETWPLRLKYAISGQMANPCPSFVFWGVSKIFLYNAAFAELMDGQQLSPGSDEAGAVAFGGQWDRISKAIDLAYDGNGSVLKGVRIGAQGRLGQRYLDISMGALVELDGEIMGAWGVCQEKTFELVAGDILRTSQRYMRSLIGTAPIGVCIIGVHPLHVAEVNDEFLRLMGIRDHRDNVLKVLEPILGSLDSIAERATPLYLREVPHVQFRDGLERMGYIDLMVSTYRSRNDKVEGMTLLAVDVTDRAEAHQELYHINEELASANEELAAANEELDAAHRNLGESLGRLEQREQQISQMVKSAPFPIALYVGREMRIIEANQSIIDVWGKGPEVIGKTYHEVLPELESQSVYDQLAQVYDTGIPYHARHQRIDLVVDGQLKIFYFNYSFTPLFDQQGNVYGVMNTAADVTDLMAAKQRIEEGERNFRNMIMQAPVAMCLLEGPSHTITLANEAMASIWGRALDAVIGLPVFDALPDARSQGLEQAMADVYLTGKTFSANEQPVSLLRHGKQDVVYQNFVYQPYRDDDGKVIGILAISVDVSEMVASRRKVEDAYGQLNLVVEAANFGMFDLDVKSGKLEWDARCREFFGVGETDEVSYEKDFVEGLHPDDRTEALRAAEWAMDIKSGGKFECEYRTVARNNGRVRWIRAVGKVYFDAEGLAERFLGAVSDVTQSKLAELDAKDAAERKGRLAAIVDSSDDVIISKDLDGFIASWNPAAEHMFGYTPQEAIGKHISLVIPDSRRNEEDMIIGRIKEGQKVHHFDTVRRAKDGSQRQLSITVSPIIDENGKVIGASKIARDISEQLAAREATQRYTERVEAINMIINGISREIDPNHIVQRVAQITIHLLDAQLGVFSAATIESRTLANYIAPITALADGEAEILITYLDALSCDDHTTTQTWDDLAHQGQAYTVGNGSKVINSVLALKVVSSQQELLGKIFFLHENPGHFTAEHEKLLQAISGHLSVGLDKAMLYEKVMQLSQKKDEFISLASHELKTPLSGIKGYVQILQRMVNDEMPAKYLAKAARQVGKLTSLVDDLLDVSKIEAGKLKLDLVTVDLSALILSTIEMLTEIYEGYHIAFDDRGAACLVMADSQRIEQVLINLLSNAVKYAPTSNRIEVVMEARGEAVVIGVRDFGMGIPEEKIGQLFSRFYRIDEHTPNISGLGIGLYLSREIILRHGGQIWVESELGVGSTFWFTLPVV
ncbi:PAS domain S-box protein [Pedobacter sp.]